MTSNRKTESNRCNSQRSTGPRTPAGKATAALNSFKHGLAALECCRLVPSTEVEELARALCGGDRDPAIFAQALKVGQNHLMLRVIRKAKVAAVERLRDRHITPFARRDSLSDEAKAYIAEFDQAELEMKARLPGLVSKYRAKLVAELGPEVLGSATSYNQIMKRMRLGGSFTEAEAVGIIVEILLDEEKPLDSETLERARKDIEANQRDEHEAFKMAAPDLICLDRYERRTWSRQKRAVREFMKFKAAASRHSGPGEEDRVA
jgi:hypothetical protein